MKRRSFLKVAGSVAGGYLVGTGAALRAAAATSEGTNEKVTGLPRRLVGRTGKKVSIVGFPGIALIHYDQKRCTEALHDAFERGVNYFDVAPAYGDAEIKMGIGLQGIDRSRIFLACKTRMRDREGAQKELERSLKRLKIDYFDLYQMHCIRTPQEVEQALGPDGAIQTFIKAKQEGKVRHFGLSAHTTRGALAALKGFRFDTIMFPINFVEYFKMGFGKPILDLAKKQGVGVMAMKPISAGAWPQDAQRARKYWYRPLEDTGEIDLALRFALSQEPVVAGIPTGFLDLLDKTIPVGCSYRPITESETQKLKEMAETCHSLFRREEEQVASGLPLSQPVYPDSPHECCPCVSV